VDTQLTHAPRIELARSLRRRYQAASRRAKRKDSGRIHRRQRLPFETRDPFAQRGCHGRPSTASASTPHDLRRSEAGADRAVGGIRPSDRICGKRLKPLLRLLVPALERHGHLKLDEVIRVKVLSMSAATIDRLLRTARSATQARKPRRVTPEIRRRIPVRTFADCNDPPPGSMEMELVAHCGERI